MRSCLGQQRPSRQQQLNKRVSKDRKFSLLTVCSIRTNGISGSSSIVMLLWLPLPPQPPLLRRKKNPQSRRTRAHQM